MDDILASYGVLLHSVDEWFASAAERSGAAVSCRTGCAECCRGLFDITLLDAFYLRKGFASLAGSEKDTVVSRSSKHLAVIQSLWPEFSAPYLLNYRPDNDWEALMPEEDETVCPLLDEQGRCLVYDFRPMTCRLNGLPLVDVSGEYFHDDWCTLNFIGEDPLQREELRWEFDRLFREELRLFHCFSDKLTGFAVNELDTFIPMALLMDYSGFDWKDWASTSDYVKACITQAL